MGLATSRVKPLDDIESPFQPMKSISTVCRFAAVRSGLVAFAISLSSAGAVDVARGGEAPQANPKAKVFVTSAEGPTEIISGSSVRDAANRTAYDADNIVIETRRNQDPNSSDPGFASMVFSNGTGAYMDPDTRLEVRRFEQERFTPNRTDMNREPSISRTNSFLSRGTVGLCNSELSTGSSMVYQTPLGEVNILGRQVVVEAQEGFTKISMLDGESSVKSGTSSDADLGGRRLVAGQQAIIRPGQGGQPPVIQIQDIPPSELTALQDKVAMACIAKRTVYFEAVTRTVDPGAGDTDDDIVAQEEGSEESEAGAGAFVESEFVSAFTSDESDQVLVPVFVVPVNLPVQFTISPSRLPR